MVHTAVKCNYIVPPSSHISGHEPKKQVHACNFPLAGNTFTVIVHPMRHNPLTQRRALHLSIHIKSLANFRMFVNLHALTSSLVQEEEGKTFPSPACPRAPLARESGQE